MNTIFLCTRRASLDDLERASEKSRNPSLRAELSPPGERIRRCLVVLHQWEGSRAAMVRPIQDAQIGQLSYSTPQYFT